MIHPREPDTDRTAYVNHFFNDAGSFLDFGGNRGNLLFHGVDCMNDQTYTCIDVSEDSIIAGKEEFPDANWVYYDRYNWMYNHQGSLDINLPEVDKHDYIFAYSVFSHTDLWELETTLKWMMTKANKKIVVSVLDIDNDFILDFFYSKRKEQYPTALDIRQWKNDPHRLVSYLFDGDKEKSNITKLDRLDSDTMIALYDLKSLKDHLNDIGIPCQIEYTDAGPIPFIIINNEEKQ